MRLLDARLAAMLATPRPPRGAIQTRHSRTQSTGAPILPPAETCLSPQATIQGPGSAPPAHRPKFPRSRSETLRCSSGISPIDKKISRMRSRISPIDKKISRRERVPVRRRAKISRSDKKISPISKKISRSGTAISRSWHANSPIGSEKQRICQKTPRKQAIFQPLNHLLLARASVWPTTCADISKNSPKMEAFGEAYFTPRRWSVCASRGNRLKAPT